MNAEEVLDVLVDWQDPLNWLANDGRQRFADARLSVFRSDEHFAVFSEFAEYSYLALAFDNWIGCAGSCLAPDDYQSQGQPPRVALLEEVPDSPLWRTDEYIHWLGDRTAFSVQVKGQRFNFKPSPEDYGRAGITFEEKRNDPNSISPAELMRFVSVALDHPFFLSEEQLRSLIEPQSDPQMSLFLQTSKWQHLMWVDRSITEEDWIENIPCWQVLARAIASGNLDEWNTQDTSGFNTDWASLERIYHENNDGYRFD